MPRLFPQYGIGSPVAQNVTAEPIAQQGSQLSIVVKPPLAGSVTTAPFTLSNEIESYSHEIKAIGGYYSASIKINDNQRNVEDWLRYGLSRHIEVYNPDLTMIWEGLVDKVVVSLGPLQFTIGPLLDIGNRVRVVYTPQDNDTEPPTVGSETLTDVANDTTSQQFYGVIEKVLSGNSAKDDTDAERMRDKFLADPAGAYPATSRDANLTGGSGPSVQLDCVGYWHWLNTYYPSDTTNGNRDRSVKIQDILAAEPNGGVFSTNYSQITANTDTVTRRDDSKKTAQTMLLEVNKTGIGGNRATMGFYAGRVFHYKAVPSSFAYVQRLTDNRGVTDRAGTIIKPWDVLPGRWIFYSDFLVGGSIPESLTGLQKDLRAGFIESARYEAPWGLSVNGIKLDDFGLFLEKMNLAVDGV